MSDPGSFMRRSTRLARRPFRRAVGRVTRMLLTSAEVRVALVPIARRITWPEHTAWGRVLVRVEEGTIEIRVAGTTTQLTAGTMIGLEPREPHDVDAVEDTAFLLFVAGREHRS